MPITDYRALAPKYVQGFSVMYHRGLPDFDSKARRDVRDSQLDTKSRFCRVLTTLRVSYAVRFAAKAGGYID
jgi:hypothetical protein